MFSQFTFPFRTRSILVNNCKWSKEKERNLPRLKMHLRLELQPSLTCCCSPRPRGNDDIHDVVLGVTVGTTGIHPATPEISREAE